MIKKTIKIDNKHGLHTRPATTLVNHASKFDSEIFLTYNGVRVNAKSILGILVLAVEPGSEVTIEARGSDEEQAVSHLVELADNKFDFE